MLNRKVLVILVGLVLLAAGLAACGAEEPGPSGESVADLPATAAPGETGAEVSGEEPAPTSTPIPPTDTPTPTPTPTPDPMAEFYIDSGDDGLELARWYRGAVRLMSWPSDGELYVTAYNGLFSYDIETFTETALSAGVGRDLDVNGGEFSVVDASTGDTVSVLQDAEPVLAFRYLVSPDELLIATYQSSSVFLWNIESGERLDDIDASGSVSSIHFSPDSSQLAMVSGPADSMGLEIKEVSSGALVWAEDKGLVDYVTDVEFSPDGSRLAVSGLTIPPYGTLLNGEPSLHVIQIDSGIVRQIQALDKEELGTFGSSGGPMLFLQDNTTLLRAKDSHINFVDVTTDEVVRVFRDSGWIENMAVNPSNTLLATSDDKQVKIWDLEKEEQLASFSGYADQVHSVDFAPDNSRVLSVIGDKLMVMDAGAQQILFEEEIDTQQGVLFGPAEDLLVRSGGGEVMLWNMAEDVTIWTHPGSVEEYSPDRTRLLLQQSTGSGDSESSTAYFVDAMTGDVLLELDTTDACGTAATPNLDRFAFATGETDQEADITVIDVASGESLAQFDAGGECSVSMSLSPSGALLAAIASTSKITVWDVATQEPVANFRHGHATMSFFGLTTFQTGSPSFLTEDVLVTTGGDWDSDEVYTWAMPGGESLGRFSTDYTAHAFSAAASVLYSSSGGLISVRDLTTGEVLDILGGHSISVKDIVLSPDGTMMLSSASDGTVVLRSLTEY